MCKRIVLDFMPLPHIRATYYRSCFVECLSVDELQAKRMPARKKIESVKNLLFRGCMLIKEKVETVSPQTKSQRLKRHDFTRRYIAKVDIGPIKLDEPYLLGL